MKLKNLFGWYVFIFPSKFTSSKIIEPFLVTHILTLCLWRRQPLQIHCLCLFVYVPLLVLIFLYILWIHWCILPFYPLIISPSIPICSVVLLFFFLFFKVAISVHFNVAPYLEQAPLEGFLTSSISDFGNLASLSIWFFSNYFIIVVSIDIWIQAMDLAELFAVILEGIIFIFFLVDLVKVFF